jgi:hypothetical protein
LALSSAGLARKATIGPFRQQSAPVNAIVDVKIADWHGLLSVDAMVSDLEIGFKAAAEYCATHHPANPLGDISVSNGASDTFCAANR